VGKGYAISLEDWSNIQTANAAGSAVGGENDPLAISSDFHNGPLSVIIPFGIWGVIAFVWILGVGFWVLFRNYRYGRPGLKGMNGFLLAMLVTKVGIFLTVFGALQNDMGNFLSYIGLSVALNHGVASPQARPATQPSVSGRSTTPLPLRPRPALARHSQI